MERVNGQVLSLATSTTGPSAIDLGDQQVGVLRTKLQEICSLLRSFNKYDDCIRSVFVCPLFFRVSMFTRSNHMWISGMNSTSNGRTGMVHIQENTE